VHGNGKQTRSETFAVNQARQEIKPLKSFFDLRLRFS